MDNKLFQISYSKNEIGTSSKLAEQILREEINALPEMNEGGINFHTMYLYDLGDKIEARLLIRNAAKNQINFQFLNFGIINEQGELLGNQVIDLTSMSPIPSMGARPYNIYIDKKNLKGEINDTCKVVLLNEQVKALQSKESKVGYLHEELSFEERTLVENHIKTTGPLVKDQISINIFKKDLDEEGRPYAILLISNSYEKGGTFGAFKLLFNNHLNIPQAIKEVEGGLKIKSQCTNVYKFYIEKQDIINPAFDIKNCTVAIEA